MALIINCKAKNYLYLNRTNTVRSYFSDIRKYGILSIEEERKLLQKVKSNNPEESISAMHKLVESNQRFVLSLAKKYSTNDNFMDVVGAANEGLINSIYKFDLSNKNNRLISYAVTWMRKYINEYLIYEYKSVKPINADKVYTYANKIRNSFYNKNERMPTLEEIQTILWDEYHMRISNIEDLEILSISSIDTPVSSEGDGDTDTFENVGEFAMNTSNNNISDKINKDYEIEKLNKYLSRLDKREEEIIRRYFGFGREEETIESLSDTFSLTKERIRQLIDNSIKKLQQDKKYF